MKKIFVFLFLIWASAKAQTLDAVLGNGNSTTKSALFNSYYPEGYAIRYGNTLLQPVALNNTLLVDNLQYKVSTGQTTYISTGYGAAVQFYNGGVLIHSVPSGTAGATAGAAHYHFVTDNTDNVYLGKSMTYTSAWTDFTIGILADKSIHIHHPATGTSTMNALVFDPSDSSVKQFAITGGGGSGTNIYNSDGTLTGQRNLLGANNALSLGTIASPLFGLQVTASNYIQLGNNTAPIYLRGGIQYSATIASNANYTIPDYSVYNELPQITANRTVTLPSMIQGQTVVIINTNTSASSWTFTNLVKNTAGSTYTTIPNGTITIFYDGSTYWKL